MPPKYGPNGTINYPPNRPTGAVGPNGIPLYPSQPPVRR